MSPGLSAPQVTSVAPSAPARVGWVGWVGPDPRAGEAGVGGLTLGSGVGLSSRLCGVEGESGVEGEKLVDGTRGPSGVVQLWAGLGQTSVRFCATSTRPSGSRASMNTLRWARPACRGEGKRESSWGPRQPG